MPQCRPQPQTSQTERKKTDKTQAPHSLSSAQSRKKESAYRSGQRAEDAVAHLYASQGYTILQRNFRSRHGEIDLIAAKKNKLHFIEVKARSDDRYVSPQEAVSAWKRRRIRLTAWYYLFRHPHLPYDYFLFDIAEVYLRRGKIHLLQNAFSTETASWTE